MNGERSFPTRLLRAALAILLGMVPQTPPRTNRFAKGQPWRGLAVFSFSLRCKRINGMTLPPRSRRRAGGDFVSPNPPLGQAKKRVDPAAGDCPIDLSSRGPKECADGSGGVWLSDSGAVALAPHRLWFAGWRLNSGRHPEATQGANRHSLSWHTTAHRFHNSTNLTMNKTTHP